ncbi:TVP38/TMEM64 family protein [Antarcticibacterium arcticum]|uniref:TVP38/TMEM64 family membrane protein n=1 Tax=Antarcticibacterium arcticum TaxID=2585771 RepID=A0A5B8YGJ1_9FLAO|nr:TVP38/TMEM64 family protein [Antarcticibacterium arcticum]QED36894.1 TVP38/TMEM64 family protein [Antarcticibacterium arcticum]
MKEKIEEASVKKSKAPLYISFVIVTSIVLAYFFIPEVQNFLNNAWDTLTSNEEKRIRSWVGDFGWIGPLVLILAMVLQMFLLVIPSIALMVVSILAYGPFFGSIIILLGIFAASTVGYIIGRYFGPVIVEKLIGHKSERKISQFLDDYGFWAIIVTRLNPLLSNDAISFVAGILKMGYWRFIGATLVGISPLIIFIAVLGDTTDGLKTGLLWGSIISLILFVGYVWWDKKRKK